MAARPTLLLSPDGSYDANGRISPTLSGAVRVVPDGGNTAWHVAEGATNLIPNPSFEHATLMTGWSLQGVTTAADTVNPYSGATSLKITNASSALGVFTASGSTAPERVLVTEGVVYTLSWAMRSSIEGRKSHCSVIWRTADGATISTTVLSTVTLSTSWQRFSFTLAAAPATAAYCYIVFYTNDTGWAVGDDYWLDAVQFEQRSYATPYFDGSFGTGHVWNGTANASTSTRTAGYVYSTIANRAAVEQGSVLMRYTLTGLPRNGAYLLDVGGLSGTNTKAYYAVWRNGTNWVSRDNTTPTEITGSSRATPNAAGEYTLYLAWDATTVMVDYGDGTVLSFPRAAHDGTWFTDRINLLSYSTGGQANTTTRGAVVFDQPLTGEERAGYTAESAWTWSNTFAPYATPVYASYTSGVFAMNAAVYRTDRLNVGREDISEYVTDLSIEGDADRTGSKLTCRLAAVKEVLRDSDWVAPYITYRPETGDVVTSQMGHYRLDIPTVEYDGTAAEYTSATGSDILNILKAVNLPETFYTPKGADVLQDIRVLISMATRGRVDSNLVQNQSFETMAAGGVNLATWVNNGTFSAGGTGTIFLAAEGVDVPSGKQWWGPRFDAMQPAGATATIVQTVGLLAGWARQKVWLSGVWYPAHASHRGYLKVEFLDASSNVISPATMTTPQYQRKDARWTREYATGTIPENATQARITVAVVDSVGGNPGQLRSMWDDITLQIISGTPIPADRITLPVIDAVAANRIQSVAGTDVLTAINTRMQAAGLQDLTATFTGLLTTRPIDQQNESPVNVYTERDSRIVDGIKVTRDAGNRFNAVTATKEDQKSGIYWSVTDFNENTNDPWNVYGDLGMISERIVVQDAVSLAALRAAARKKLAEASIQESLSMAVLPDQRMTIYDIIRVDAPNRANGRWGVRKLKWGTSADDPLVQVSARRIVIGS